ncbi:MAG: N-acetylmuramoyl-L-alanine amidase [Sphingomonadales bacterium]
MSPGDFLLCTFLADPNFPPTLYPGEIRFVDVVARTVDCHLVDTGQLLTADYSPADTGSWTATDESGTSYLLETHDIYVAQNADPGPDDVAVLTFSDGSKALCFVESVTDTLNVQLYQRPYARLSIDGDTLLASEWDLHPAGEVLTIQRCVRDNKVPPEELIGVFSDGRWSLATRRDAHPGRIGGAIHPFATVVHTTDQPSETWETLINNWTTTAGNGACAHFAIGRTAQEGVIQLTRIDRNANHAGGPGHGSFIAGAQSWHPNEVSVGIELHCAGAVRRIDGSWRFFEDGAAHGLPIPDDEVIPDPQRPGRGWHKVTDYQYRQLAALLDGLDAALDPLPEGCVAHSIEAPPAYGIFPTGRVVGHVSLTAARRGDPWPPTCDWIRAR